ncbi:astacin, partial [Teladorsagia circumcincta]
HHAVHYREDFPDRVVIYTPYEYGSIMHYGPQSFNEGANAIMPLDKRYQWTIGSKIPSFYDIMMVNKHYHCDGIL